MKKILRPFLSFVMIVFRIFPIKRNYILFESFYGKSYNDNPKAISDALKGKGLVLIWIVKDPCKFHDKDVIFVKEHSIRCLYYLAVSQVWVDNCRKPIWIRKRKKQFYIQTWHAGISNKLGEGKAEDKLPKEYVRGAKHDSAMADLFLSNSKWLTNSYKECFWYDGEILEEGLPREDALVGNRVKYHEKICRYYNINTNYHFILYAPTFRNDKNLNVYDIDYKRLVNVFNGDGLSWKIIIRLHPNIQDEKVLFDSDNTLNGSKYPDINDLIMASDYFISDYSSCMFDAMLAGCKVVLYASDIDKYRYERGFAFNWDELPFYLASNNDELHEYITTFDNEDYKKKVESFKKRCGMVELGNASNAVANRIISLIKV